MGGGEGENTIRTCVWGGLVCYYDLVVGSTFMVHVYSIVIVVM